VDLLAGLFAQCGPQVRPVFATTERETALAWYEGLAAFGIEGLVCEALDSPCDPRAARARVKVRHAATVDALIVGIVRAPWRPTAAVDHLRSRVARVPRQRRGAHYPQPRQDPKRLCGDRLARRSGNEPVAGPWRVRSH
jgi:hypothetical protein